jgi:glycosyltransferase involved in cell wall biosynthesis
MNILAHIPIYKGSQNSGGETYIHDMLKGLSKFNNVKAVTDKDTNAKGKHLFDGVMVHSYSDLKECYNWADIVVTHLGSAGRAVNMTRARKMPLVHIFHNTFPKATVKKDHAIIYNSEWSIKEFNYTNKKIVFYPPTKCEDYKTTKGNCYTLVNLNENKGGKFLIELAKMNPDKMFLGVRGGYGEQIEEPIKNIKYIDGNQDIKKIFNQTKVLLMPSKYESWGKVGVEAMCSGIPVLASNANGLKESLDYAGVFCEIDASKWTDALNYIEKDYQNLSDKCIKRAKELDPDFEGLNKFINDYEQSYSKSITHILG